MARRVVNYGDNIVGQTHGTPGCISLISACVRYCPPLYVKILVLEILGGARAPTAPTLDPPQVGVTTAERMTYTVKERAFCCDVGERSWCCTERSAEEL